MSARLEAYLTLERLMLALDEAGDPAADQVRDLMDPIWYALTDDEHALLDARTIGTGPARVPVGSWIFTDPSDLTDRGVQQNPVRGRPVAYEFKDWELAA